jgi:hypothetical protein
MTHLTTQLGGVRFIVRVCRLKRRRWRRRRPRRADRIAA